LSKIAENCDHKSDPCSCFSTQPHFEAGPPAAAAGPVLAGASSQARPSICHLPSIDRRPSVMLVNCLEESQFASNRYGASIYCDNVGRNFAFWAIFTYLGTY
jgi:hypothetical protein